MRYRGNRRDAPGADVRSGRHRRVKDGVADPASLAERALTRPRRMQPRDALGRFRKLRPDERRDADARAAEERPGASRAIEAAADGREPRQADEARATGRRPPEGAADRSEPRRYTWRDFELDADLPRAAPQPADAPDERDGRRHCGVLEAVLYRQWTGDRPPPPDVVRAVDSLAALPDGLKNKLAEGLDGIYVGAGGVPDLDDMQYLQGEPLPSGKGTWDICAGAYGDRTIVVGDQPSPTPDVMLHEIGHALDDLDGIMSDDGPRQWQSDSPEFRVLYRQCLPYLTSDFHRQAEDLGRHEFFADAFAAIASRQRPALVDMLGGDTRTALNVMLFFNRRYGI